ncbi:MAG: hypothetical protein AAFQ94_27760 [Bacteroidota bacterium]
MSAFTFKLAYLNPTVFRKKFFGKGGHSFSFQKQDDRIVPLYHTVGQSSIGEIPFVSQSAILYEETHHLCIDAEGPRGKLALMGWGNIPGLQTIDPESLFSQGAYFTNYDAKEVHIATSGHVEIKSYDQRRGKIKVVYEFDMQRTNEAFELSGDRTFMIAGQLEICEIANKLSSASGDHAQPEDSVKAGLEK